MLHQTAMAANTLWGLTIDESYTFIH